MNAPLGTLATQLRGVPAAMSIAIPLLLTGLSGAASAQSMQWDAGISVNQACVKCNASYGDLKVHSSGNALAIWVQNDGVPDIAVARYEAGTGVWRGFRTLFTGTQTGDARSVFRPQLAMDAQGNAIAVWTENGTNTIYYATYQATSATWSAPAVAHVGQNFSYTEVRIGLDAQNNAFLHWREGYGRQPMAKRFDAGTQTWSASLPLGAADASQSDMAVDPLGNAMVVWLRSSDQSVQFSRYEADTGQWRAARQAGEAAQGSSVRVVLDRNGNGTAIWNTATDTANPYGRLAAFHYRATANRWSPPRLLQASGTVLRYPDLAVDATGNVLVAWGQAADAMQPTKIAASRYNAGNGKWSMPESVSSGDQHDLFARATLDSRGNAMVVWSSLTGFTDNGDRTFRKGAARYDASTGRWGQPSFAAQPVQEAYSWGVGLDENGNAITLYQQDSGYRWNGAIIYGMRANRLAPGQ